MAIGHGRMIHRVNSEGLRRRAIAPEAAAARQEGVYSLRLRALSTVRPAKWALWIVEKVAVFTGFQPPRA
jgi:hypothetical protein